MSKVLAIVLLLALPAIAADKPKYRDGTVVKVYTREEAAGGGAPQRPGDTAAGPDYGTTYFLRISAGRRIHTAQFVPDGPKDYPITLSPGQKVRFRIAGDLLILRAPGGKEWRTSLVSSFSPVQKK
jgi:hypothetical protein